jgi:hypothetical protein
MTSTEEKQSSNLYLFFVIYVFNVIGFSSVPLCLCGDGFSFSFYDRQDKDLCGMQNGN